MTTVYEFEARALTGEPVRLRDFAGKVMLVVNTASRCGYTPQYRGLEDLYQKYRERGLVVLGFPCNQFGAQEPGSALEIGNFCQINYGVSFPMFEKIEVNGDGAHPLYAWLKRSARGLFGTQSIKWNFTKFLLDRKGEVIARYAPMRKPEDLAPRIEALL
jgi:glutathione peroxidase